MDVSRLFAEYRPRTGAGPATPPESLVIRDATPSDADAMARIAQERNGGELAVHVAGFERALRARPDGPGALLLVAAVGERVIGYAKAGVFEPPADAPANCAPRGWYLSGVTIEPPMRRRGIGLAMTRVRLDRIATHSDAAYYFASAMNRASIDLHARLGFVEVTRDFWFPDTTFTGGVGILFRVTLAAHR